MADNNSSNNVAIVAILIIVILAAIGLYYFVNQGGLKQTNTTVEPTKIEVNIPKPNNNTAPNS